MPPANPLKAGRRRRVSDLSIIFKTFLNIYDIFRVLIDPSVKLFLETFLRNHQLILKLIMTPLEMVLKRSLHHLNHLNSSYKISKNQWDVQKIILDAVAMTSGWSTGPLHLASTGLILMVDVPLMLSKFIVTLIVRERLVSSQ